MLNLWATGTTNRTCDGISRRNFLSVGTLGLGALSLADLLRLEAHAEETSRKSIIMVYLPGGPSHIDLYDMKPDAPVEIRGEFASVRTNVPGIDICELLPLQSRIADKFSILRGFKPGGGHDARELTTGFRRANRPAFGSVVSRVQGSQSTGLPAYVSLIQETNLPFGEDPMYLGPAHRPFAPRSAGMDDLILARGLTLDRLDDRTGLMRTFDGIRRELDVRGEMRGLDAITQRALDIVRSPATREALDVGQEPRTVREKYGLLPGSQSFLLARRLVERGVRIVTVCGGWQNGGGPGSSSSLGNWDTHEENFPRIRMQAPHFDRALYALITDLHERGLDRDVAVVACGEMGRAPRVGVPNPGSNASSTGRDHWDTGFALIAGGGLRMGQIVGATDRRGERPVGHGYTPQNLLATLYRVLGIDSAMTFPDHLGRPQYLLEDRTPIDELL
jgi:hypothetical protein